MQPETPRATSISQHYPFLLLIWLLGKPSLTMGLNECLGPFFLVAKADSLAMRLSELGPLEDTGLRKKGIL